MASDPTSGPGQHAEHAAAVLSIDLRQAWPVLMARAVFAVALGLVMLIVPGVTLLLVAWAFGIYALVDGAAQVVDAIRRRHRPRWWFALLLGLIGVVAGVIALIWPYITAVVLALLVGCWALVTGVIEIVSAMRQRRERRRTAWLVVAGLLSVVAGVLILIWPVHGAVAVAMLLGVFATAYGVVLAGLALAVRRAGMMTSDDDLLRSAPASP
jgi:uncharacterized membrane protein HdeD (DUF308 family)